MSKESAFHVEALPTVKHAENKDIALNVLAKVDDLEATIDLVQEQKLVRKIDLLVIPFICVTYLVTYIDKATLGYAAIFGLEDDLNLHGTQYSWLGWCEKL